MPWNLVTTGSGNGFPDSKVHGANMGPTWVLAAPDGPHVGPMNLAIRGLIVCLPPSYYLDKCRLLSIGPLATHFNAHLNLNTVFFIKKFHVEM